MNIVNKYLLEERTSPELNITSNNIQLIIKTGDQLETIDVLFSSLENKINWEKNFLEAKKILSKFFDCHFLVIQFRFFQLKILPNEKPLHSNMFSLFHIIDPEVKFVDLKIEIFAFL